MRGAAEGQVRLARIYSQERSIKNEANAVAGFRRAAEQGHSAAQVMLADMIGRGAGAKIDLFEAIVCLEIAAANGTANYRKIARELLAEIGPAHEPSARRAEASTKAKAWRVKQELYAQTAGLFVSGEGHILTSLRNVAGCHSVFVGLRATVTLPANVLARDATNELALLRVRADNAAPIRVAVFNGSAQLRAPDQVVEVGSPMPAREGRAYLWVGNISELTGSKGDTRYLGLMPELAAWHSGVALVDRSGR